MTPFAIKSECIDEIIKAVMQVLQACKSRLKDCRSSGGFEYDEEFIESGNLVYDRKSGKKFFTDTNLTIRPFIASERTFQGCNTFRK